MLINILANLGIWALGGVSLFCQQAIKYLTEYFFWSSEIQLLPGTLRPSIG